LLLTIFCEFQISHVESAGVVAHAGDQELQRKIEGAWAPLHALWTEDPLIDESRVAVKKFADRDFAGHGFSVEKGQEKIG
jgi:hypothetical protein